VLGSRFVFWVRFGVRAFGVRSSECGEDGATIMMQTSTPQLQRDFENAVTQAIID
jgi:hypothetical protein